MPYQLSPAADPLNIAEREYASAAEIKFTTFTSCIGVIAKNGDSLTAVHLSMTAPDGSLFDVASVTQVLNVLPATYEKVTVVGYNSWWLAPVNTVAVAYRNLVGEIENRKNVEGWEVDYVDEPENQPAVRCAAKIENGNIIITWEQSITMNWVMGD